MHVFLFAVYSLIQPAKPLQQVQDNAVLHHTKSDPQNILMHLRLCQDKGGREFPVHMNVHSHHTLGIDIGSTTVKIAVIHDGQIVFSDYERHYANIQETLALLLSRAQNRLGEISVYPGITGSGGLTLSKYLQIPFTQEVVAVASALKAEAPQTDVAIELGGEDAKIIYFTGGIDQRMNGI